MAAAGPVLLAARYPAVAKALQHISLASLATPLSPAAALGASLGCPSLYLKDDGRAAPGYGGNKIRKLEYLLADAKTRGCTAVITFGAAGSNHVLATAVHARVLGLHCHAVLTPQPPTNAVAATLRWHALLGTTLHAADGYAGSLAVAAAIRAQHPGGPECMAVIPWGGSSPLGVVGFVAGALELAAQLAGQGLPAPQAIYLPLGTMGTVAGLALGLRLAGLPTRVVAVQVVPDVVASSQGLASLFRETNRLLARLDPSVPLLADPLATIELRTDQLGEGYAIPTPPAAKAVALAADAGLVLETTYSGKALAALAADTGRYAPDSGPVVFWVTCNAQPKPANLAAVDPHTIPMELRHYLAKQ